MGNRIGYAKSQRGATAVLAAICIVVLVGILGLVVDLGIVYARKTELQNAADAAALAGARELDGTAAGVNAARAQAIAIAALNRSDFGSTPVAIADINIEFAPSPAGAWVGLAAAQGAPADKWFVKVDTAGIAQGTRPTWFVRVLDEALANTTASGLAVAGRTVCDGLPIFACKLGTSSCSPTDPENCGFTVGQSYVFNDQWKPSNPIGPGNVGWLDPVPPGSPSVINGTDDMRDIICRGRTMCLAPGIYTSLTQGAFNPTADALNTRFGVFQGGLNKTEYKLGEGGKAACAVDTNIKEYRWEDTDSGGSNDCKGGDEGCPAEWMATNPTAQSEDTGGAPGVHWAAVRPPSGLTGPLAVEDSPGTPPPGFYPPAPGTPYSQTSGDYWKAPPSSGVVTQPGRRILTIGLATNCGTINGSGKPVDIRAFGHFLMQREAFDTGPEKGFHAEFMGLVPSGPTVRPEIKLYR